MYSSYHGNPPYYAGCLEKSAQFFSMYTYMYNTVIVLFFLAISCCYTNMTFSSFIFNELDSSSIEVSLTSSLCSIHFEAVG